MALTIGYSLLLCRVQVVRMHGDLDTTLRVVYTCKDDTAVAGLDYELTEVRASTALSFTIPCCFLLHHAPLAKLACSDLCACVSAQGVLVFQPGQEMAEIVVKIVDDDMSEPDVHFNIILSKATIDGGDEVMIMRKTTTVTIVDDDDGGVLVFELPTFEVRPWEEAAWGHRRATARDGRSVP